jgi:hypothetical protein
LFSFASQDSSARGEPKSLQHLFEQGTHAILNQVDSIRRAEGIYLLNEIAKRYGLRITVHESSEMGAGGVEDEAEGRAVKQRKISKDTARNGKQQPQESVQGKTRHFFSFAVYLHEEKLGSAEMQDEF